MVTELFGQGGPRGRVEVVVGCCRSSTEWFLSPGSLGCSPSSPSRDLGSRTAPTLLPINCGENISPSSCSGRAFRTTGAFSCVLCSRCVSTDRRKSRRGRSRLVPEHR